MRRRSKYHYLRVAGVRHIWAAPGTLQPALPASFACHVNLFDPPTSDASANHTVTMANIPAGKPPGKDQPGLRYPSNGKTIYHRPLNRSRTAELSQASFAYLFSEMVSYAQRKVTVIEDLEKRYAVLGNPPYLLPLFLYPSPLTCTSLNTHGHPIGLKLLDLLLYREPPRSQTRSLNILSLLHFIEVNVWTHLFGRRADRLEQSSDPNKPDEFMVIDNEPLVNAYISVPRDMNQLNCAAFVAGIIEGVCDGAAFPAKVTAHTVAEGDMWPGRTVFVIKFESLVVEREAYLGKGS